MTSTKVPYFLSVSYHTMCQDPTLYGAKCHFDLRSLHGLSTGITEGRKLNIAKVGCSLVV